MRGTVARVALPLVFVAAALVLTGCAAGANDVSTVAGGSTAGFWQGVWHGMIYPVTFIVSLFNKNVNVYEVHNNGGWYNFGFVLGIAILHTIFAGPARAARKASSKGGQP